MRFSAIALLFLIALLESQSVFADPLTITRTTPGTMTCLGETYTYHSSVQGNTNDWSITGGTIISSSGDDVSVVWNSTSGRLSEHVVVRVRVCNDPDPCVWEETDYDGFLDVSATAISATLSASPMQVCPGQQVNLTASGTGTITWSGGGLDGLTGSTQSVNPIVTTTYTITTVNGGCTLSKSVTVTIQGSPPNTPATPVASQNSCDAKTLHVASAPPIGVTWYWQTSGTGSETGLTSAVDFVAENSGTYYLRAFSNTCGWSIQSSSITVAINKGIDCQEALNYIISTDVMTSGITTQEEIEALPIGDVSRAITYYDGLGRAIEQVNWKQTPEKKDLITPVVYDNLGRQPLQYLPFVDETQDNGRFKVVAFQNDNNYVNAFYNTPSDNIADDARPFTETQYEASPLSRPVRQFGAGEAWSDNNKFVGFEYKLNTYGTGSGQEKIVAYKVDENGLLARRPVTTGYIETGGYYSTNQLFIKVTTDEQGNAVREYTSKSGRVILKKVQAVVGSTDLNNLNEWAFTYYVYDDRNNLVMVLPPEAVKSLGN